MALAAEVECAAVAAAVAVALAVAVAVAALIAVAATPAALEEKKCLAVVSVVKLDGFIIF